MDSHLYTQKNKRTDCRPTILMVVTKVLLKMGKAFKQAGGSYPILFGHSTYTRHLTMLSFSTRVISSVWCDSYTHSVPA